MNLQLDPKFVRYNSRLVEVNVRRAANRFEIFRTFNRIEENATYVDFFKVRATAWNEMFTQQNMAIK